MRSRNRLGNVSTSLCGIIIILLSLLAPGKALANVTLLDQNDWKVLMGGFVELDMIYDSTRSYTEVVGNNPIAKSGTMNGDNGRTQFSDRNTRFDFTILPPLVGSWKTKGYLEFDLLGYEASVAQSAASAVTEQSYFSNPTVRMRHAYFTAESEGWQILAGQTWTLFGWQPYYVMTTDSVAPIPGELYERTAQLTGSKTLQFAGENTLQIALQAARPLQRDSLIPDINGGLRFTFPGRKSGFVAPYADIKTEPMSVAVSGTVRQIEIFNNSAGTTSAQTVLNPAAIAVNGMIPILASSDGSDVGNTLSFSGEFSTGTGYGDALSGWTGGLTGFTAPTTAGPAATNAANTNLDGGEVGFDSSGNTPTLVHFQTFTLQLQYHLPTSFTSFVDLGYAQLYSNNVSAFPNTPTNSLYDRTEGYFANFFHDFSKQIRAAVGFYHFDTHYITGEQPLDNRIQLSGWFRF